MIELLDILAIGGYMVQGDTVDILYERIDDLSTTINMLWTGITILAGAVGTMALYIKSQANKLSKEQNKRADFLERYLRLRQTHDPKNTG